jgi:hypothetical protein
VGDRLSAGIFFYGLFAPVHPYVGSVFDAEAHLTGSRRRTSV